ncbi:snapalysin [Actinopolyspora biskrensis]|uniref:Extracellular small neutral protease n=1 Tax=Actinopolyspora biskrensis TaxID=1470178 RepID=A0A852YZP4_9ACTN|nr:snapalysin family zinc-dependent metalloprotease [Actinopolyspora biskrensis]NYH79648.1 snapalysin [Actinopolyspora biskrensis]
MQPRAIRFVLPVLALALFTLVGFSPGSGTALAADGGPARSQATTVVTYDAGGAAEFGDVVRRATGIWNEHLSNVEFEAVDGSADVVILADDGWPRARPTGLGTGTVWMGRQAVEEGHDPTRIAAHELGHILGLPDRRTGVCEELMSGHSAGTDCTSATPNAAEVAEVERNFSADVFLPLGTHVYGEPTPAP